MPTYVYKCDSCGAQFEKFQSFKDEPIRTCPACAQAVRRVFQPVGIVFKGSGWYINDSRSSSSSTPTKNGDDTKAETSDTNTEAKTDSKTEKSDSKSTASESSTPSTAAPSAPTTTNKSASTTP